MEGTTTPKTTSSSVSSRSSSATTALRGVVAALAMTSSAAFVAPTARTTGPLAARRSAGKDEKSRALPPETTVKLLPGPLTTHRHDLDLPNTNNSGAPARRGGGAPGLGHQGHGARLRGRVPAPAVSDAMLTGCSGYGM